MEKSITNEIKSWVSNSVTLKLVTIIFLSLLLLIPESMIKSIIREREHMHQNATTEVSSKWAGNQMLNGPVLTIPMLYELEKDDKLVTISKNFHLLPEKLVINGEIEPKSLKRGIYEVVVYSSDLSISGNFDLNIEAETSNLKEILWDKAFLTIGISDLRGIKDHINFKWDGSSFYSVFQPGNR